jgi:hypothetical protein
MSGDVSKLMTCLKDESFEQYYNGVLFQHLVGNKWKLSKNKNKFFDLSNFGVFDVKGDGHCAYRSLSVALFGNQDRYMELRRVAWLYYQTNSISLKPYLFDSENEIKEQTLGDGNSGPVGLRYWYCSSTSGRILANALRRPIIMCGEGNSLEFSAISVPALVPIREWRRPIYLYFVGAHYQALVPIRPLKLPWMRISVQQFPVEMREDVRVELPRLLTEFNCDILHGVFGD